MAVMRSGRVRVCQRESVWPRREGLCGGIQERRKRWWGLEGSVAEGVVLVGLVRER